MTRVSTRLWTIVFALCLAVPAAGIATALTLEPHQEIVIAFGTAAQLPSPVPASRADQLDDLVKVAYANDEAEAERLAAFHAG